VEEDAVAVHDEPPVQLEVSVEGGAAEVDEPVSGVSRLETLS
jgi:hypothetical protein